MTPAEMKAALDDAGIHDHGELPWTRWDRLVHTVTGRVSTRVYACRVLQMADDDRLLGSMPGAEVWWQP